VLSYKGLKACAKLSKFNAVHAAAMHDRAAVIQAVTEEVQRFVELKLLSTLAEIAKECTSPQPSSAHGLEPVAGAAVSPAVATEVDSPCWGKDRGGRDAASAMGDGGDDLFLETLQSDECSAEPVIALFRSASLFGVCSHVGVRHVGCDTPVGYVDLKTVALMLVRF
jgi:hypothetical protein